MNFKVRGLPVFIIALFVMSGLAEAAIGLKLDPGMYEIESQNMVGEFAMAKMKNGSIAKVDIKSKSSPDSVAYIEGVATIKGKNISIESADNDEHRVTITLLDKKRLVIKATDKTNKNCAPGVSFDGVYTYKNITP